MWEDIDQYVEKFHMLDDAELIVMGLSGGADSVCLARYLLKVRQAGGPGIVAVHVNHSLRGSEADRDQEFVRNFCECWDIPLHIYKKDIRKISETEKLSLEEAGRKVRYSCFREVMKEAGRGKRTLLAVAHHADDLAETMIFRMIRGTGPKGLVGIRPVQDEIIRPLLGIKREDIEKILHQLGQGHVEDSTNQEPEYSRNYIRHRILYDMKQINPQVVEHLCSLAGQQADLLAFTEPLIGTLSDSLIQKKEGGYFADSGAFLSLDDYSRQEIARRMLFLAAGKEKDIGSVHVKQFIDLMNNGEGKRQDFPYGLTAVRKNQGLFLSGDVDPHDDKNREENAAGQFFLEIPLPAYEEGKCWKVAVNEKKTLYLSYERYKGEQIVKKRCVKYFDYDKIKYKLCLRTRQAGDYFILDDQDHHKRLNRYFIDSKIPADQREKQWLLAEGSHILWIIGERTSEGCRIRPDTTRMLTVTLA